MEELAHALRDELLTVFPPPEYEVLADTSAVDGGVQGFYYPLVQVYRHKSFEYVSIYLMGMFHCKWADVDLTEHAVNYEYTDPDSIPKIIADLRRHFGRNSGRTGRRTKQRT